MNNEIYVGDIVEIIDNTDFVPHDFTMGYQYKVDKIIKNCNNELLYMLCYKDFSNGNSYTEGVFRNEIKLIERGQNGT